MIRIYNILTELFGQPKQGCFDKTVTQYQFNCPNCAEENGGVDYKYNLEISFSLGQYHCWACGISGRISKLVKIYGGKQTYDDYIRIINEIKESKYYNLDFFKENRDIFEEDFVKLPKTFQKINLSNCRDRQLVKYLNKRKIDQDIIDTYNIGVTGWDGEEYTWKNRIIIPSYDYTGDLNYFIGRTYKENDKRIKYRNCDFDKKNIILHEDKINWDCDIYLVEGAFDCIYYYNSIGMMGKTLTKDSKIYKILKERSHANIVVCLDGDTTDDEISKIYLLLDNANELKGRVRYIKLGTNDIKYKDFGEIYEAEGKSGIIRAFKNQKQYSEQEIIKIKNLNFNQYDY